MFRGIRDFFKRIVGKEIIIIFLIINIIYLCFVGYMTKNIGGLINTLENKIDIHTIYQRDQIKIMYGFLAGVIKNTNKNDQSVLKLCEVIINNLTKMKKEYNGKIKNINENNSRLVKKHEQTTGELSKFIKKTAKDLKAQKEKIEKEIKKLSTIDIANVEKIKEANTLIYNTSQGTCGSGSHIKINNKDYILTASHLIKEKDDKIYAITNNGTMHPLNLIKKETKTDLALLKIEGATELPYLTISSRTPKEGSIVTVIGNPDGLEDVFTNGIVAKIEKNKYILTNKIYFGNSGGAVLYKGKIVGVISQIGFKFLPVGGFVCYSYSSNLEAIQNFLKDIKSNPQYKRKVFTTQKTSKIVPYVPGELIVKFKSTAFDKDGNIKRLSIIFLNQRYGMSSMEKIFNTSYKLNFSKTTNIIKLCMVYSKNEYVIYAEPNFIVKRMEK